MKKNKMYHLVCGILVISAAASISVSAGTAKRKVKPCRNSRRYTGCYSGTGKENGSCPKRSISP